MTILVISMSLLFGLCLFNSIQNVLYRESIARLERTIDELRQANRNLSQIIQDDIQVKVDFEENCG